MTHRLPSALAAVSMLASTNLTRRAPSAPGGPCSRFAPMAPRSAATVTLPRSLITAAFRWEAPTFGVVLTRCARRRGHGEVEALPAFHYERERRAQQPQHLAVWRHYLHDELACLHLLPQRVEELAVRAGPVDFLLIDVGVARVTRDVAAADEQRYLTL